MSEAAPLERAIAALRGGRPVGFGTLTILALETATPSLLDMLDPGSESNLLLSGARGAALGLGNLLEAADADAPVLVERTPWLDCQKRALRAATHTSPAQDLTSSV